MKSNIKKQIRAGRHTPPLALVNIKVRTIPLSKNQFKQGTKLIINTLIKWISYLHDTPWNLIRTHTRQVDSIIVYHKGPLHWLATHNLGQRALHQGNPTSPIWILKGFYCTPYVWVSTIWPINHHPCPYRRQRDLDLSSIFLDTTVLHITISLRITDDDP